MIASCQFLAGWLVMKDFLIIKSLKVTKKCFAHSYMLSMDAQLFYLNLRISWPVIYETTVNITQSNIEI